MDKKHSANVAFMQHFSDKANGVENIAIEKFLPGRRAVTPDGRKAGKKAVSSPPGAYCTAGVQRRQGTGSLGVCGPHVHRHLISGLPHRGRAVGGDRVDESCGVAGPNALRALAGEAFTGKRRASGRVETRLENAAYWPQKTGKVRSRWLINADK
jgi:hypothetical protein